MSSVRCAILGAGGHARALLEALRAAGGVEVVAALDPDPALAGTSVLGVPIVGGDDRLPSLDVERFVVGLGGTGDNAARRRLFEIGLAAGLEPLEVRHPSAVVSHSARLGAGCQLLPLSVVHTGARLGVGVIVNSGAVVEHDCELGDHVHVASGAVIASTVRVGDAAHVGAGASVRQSLSIGAGAMVGAGAVVVCDVPPQTVVVGVPARPIAGRSP